MENILDDSWVKSAFLLPPDAMVGGVDTAISRIYSRSMASAADTTLGGSYVLNPLAQWTRYADIKHNTYEANESAFSDGLIVPHLSRNNSTSADKSNGMGRTYFEKIYENMQVAHFRVGVPQFNSMTSFYSNYYSVPAATLARTGRAPGFFYKIGVGIGTVVSIPLLPFVLASKVVKFFLNRPNSKYYSLKPTMHNYWSAVTSITNAIAANMGIIPEAWPQDGDVWMEREGRATKDDVEMFSKILPGIYRKPNGGIDVFQVATRGKAISIARREILNRNLARATWFDNLSIFSRRNEDALNQSKRLMYGKDLSEVYSHLKNVRASSNGSLLESYKELWYEESGLGSVNKMGVEPSELDTVKIESTFEKMFGKEDEVGLTEALKRELEWGGQFVSFRVDYTGTQSESFSNTTKEPSIKQNINSISASSRETRFSAFDGNIDSGGIFASAIGAAKDFLGGVMQGVGIQGLAQLGGSAFADIPNVWDSSTAEINKISFTIPLRSPYGDPMSRLQNIILPMAALMAMALPLSTGKQSHNSPFIIEVFSQGRVHSRLAIIDSLSFTRGVGDVGWNNNGGFLGVDVQVGILDLSSVVSMPLQVETTIAEDLTAMAGYGLGKAADIATLNTFTGGDGAENARKGLALASSLLGSTWDDDNNYTDYLAILGGIPLEDAVQPSRKWALRMARQQAKFDDLTSPTKAASFVSDNIAGEIIRNFNLFGSGAARN